MRKISARFCRAKDGNFAIISSLLMVPLVLGAAVLVDLDNISRRQDELQQAMDSAALAVAREGKDVTQKDADDIAERFLAANFNPKTTSFKVVRSGTSFTVEGRAMAEMAFGGLFGYDFWPVAASATADIAYASYEIALVLDTTGSMKGGKLTAMKDAVLGLIDTMSMQVNDENKLKFALVPFATFVNVGSGYGPDFDKNGKQIPGTGADWLDLSGASTIPQSELGDGASRFQIYANLGQDWSGCVETRPVVSGVDYGVSDAEADPSNPNTLFVPAISIDEPDSGYANSYIKSNAKPRSKEKQERRKRFAKYGVATDADANPLLGGLLDPLLVPVGDLLNRNGTKTIKIDSSASPLTGKPKGPGHGCEMQAISPLSADYDALGSKVKALEANGTTNIMEGVAWGMRVLSPHAPFTEARDKKLVGIEKIMIVLTDGSNVFGNAPNDLGSSYSSFGYLVDGRVGTESGGASVTNELMNERTLAACANAKSAGVQVYTIRLEEPNVATGMMLKECASSEADFFDAPSRSQLDEVFAKIKERIVRVRISS
jgi:Flp pilus assembly protein TadG